MIVLITPTGERPMQFKLCCRWMRNQTYKGKVLWIIVDDGRVNSTDITEKFPDNWTIIYKYPATKWHMGLNTQARNLKLGINICKAFPKGSVEGIGIIEDDDYYSSTYLETMVEKLKGFDIIGEQSTTYYHIPARRYLICHNDKHASLFQTMFTIAAIPTFEKCYPNKYIDMMFFKEANLTDLKINLFKKTDLAIGIKGLPGREGIGGGHNPLTEKTPDPNLTYLKSVLGEDYKYYYE